MRYSRGSCANTRREDRRCLLFLHLTIVAGVPRPRCESRVSDRDGSGEKKGRSGATREQRARVLRARASAGHPDIEINSHFGMAVTSMGSQSRKSTVRAKGGKRTKKLCSSRKCIQGVPRENRRKLLECRVHSFNSRVHSKQKSSYTLWVDLIRLSRYEEFNSRQLILTLRPARFF